jgi:hypothetical protein
MRTALLAPLLAATALAHAAAATTVATTAATTASCPVVDEFAEFVAFAQRTQPLPQDARLERFEHEFVAAHAALYVPTVTGFAPGPALDAAARGTLQALDADGALAAHHAALLRTLPRVIERFAAAFPDFRCDFPIHVAPTFGAMDGAGRIVDGRPALVLGPDTIARVESDEQLPVFVAHEFFHRHHARVAGFGDDLGERDLIWRALWSEGLATYASAQLNPQRPLADAWLLPRDLQERTEPLVPTLAAELLPALDRVDAQAFGLFFMGGSARAKALARPYRTGYYMGYLVARRLGERYTLPELARLQGPALRSEIGAALAEMARADPVAGR